MKTKLYEKRKEKYPEDKWTINQIIVPQDYQLTKYNEKFLLSSSNPTNGILVFGTIQFLCLLCSSSRVYVDGTFEVASHRFCQMFTFHILVNEEMFCAIYSLLPDKKLITYRKLITEIKSIANQNGKNFNPEHLHCDFALCSYYAKYED